MTGPLLYLNCDRRRQERTPGKVVWLADAERSACLESLTHLFLTWSETPGPRQLFVLVVVLLLFASGILLSESQTIQIDI